MKPKSQNLLSEFTLESARELEQILGTMVAEMVSIQGTTSDPHQQHRLNVALTAADRASTVTRNLIAANTPKSQHLVESDISETLLDILDENDVAFEQRQVKVVAKIESELAVKLPKPVIRQIAYNALWISRESAQKGATLDTRLKKNRSEIIWSISLNETRKLPSISAEKTLPTSLELALKLLGLLLDRYDGYYTFEDGSEKSWSLEVSMPAAKLEETTNFDVRRLHRRVATHFPVEVKMGATSVSSQIILLSQGGCFIPLTRKEMDPVPDVNTKLSLRVSYFENETFEIQKARVACVVPRGELPGIGIEFLEMGELEKKMLTAIVRARSG